MKKGYLSVKFGCGMTAMCWKDKREVFMLSNMHDPDMSTSTLCNDRCEKPGLVTSYNTNMGFVDLSDRMVNSYTFGRKTLKWTKKLFFHLLDLTVLNAFILYKIKTGNNICHKIFRLNLIRQLLQNENIETIITSPERNARNNRPENKHWPECKKVQRRCAMCKSKARISKAKRRKRVTRDMSTLKNSMLELAAKFDDNYNTGLIKSFMFGLNKTEIKTMTDILSRYKFRDSHARISKAKRRKRVTRDMSTLKNSMLELAAKFDDNYNTGLIKSFMFGLNKTEIKTMTDILSRYKFRDSHDHEYPFNFLRSYIHHKYINRLATSNSKYTTQQ
ncbi:piggyBac transposable element-derived protein 4 [Trichonephila clavipes]|nr:piggyBac transposable element-derived protein 4 [Trichonephila clavipes]